MIEEHRDVMMENYQEKYSKELYQQEINSNIHTTQKGFLDFVTILLPLAVDISENLYCGCQNFYHGNQGVGGDGNSCLYIYKRWIYQSIG